ncbi:hypothetical protein MPAR168_22240 [Methylorubrum populi]|uniref:hypothetical protein n=1 Tax=Methylorubrum populi TaxID=223967 RepID=UPI002F2DA82F
MNTTEKLDAFWEDFRRTILPLRPSQYDITSSCNLTCEGCLFFSGSDSDGVRDEQRPGTVDAFFAEEARRGVRYGYFGGAEPSLAEAKLRAAAAHIPYGVVFTNGIKRLSADIPYRVHVSVWGAPERSRALRGADILDKQIRNYRGDPRAVFVFTISAANLADIAPIARRLAAAGLPLTFNHYSPTRRYLAFLAGDAETDRYHSSRAAEDDLRLTPLVLARVEKEIGRLMEEPGSTILYSNDFNKRIHDSAGLYVDRDPENGVARDCGVLLSESLRHYNTDLNRSNSKCCSPNVDCAECRLYAQSFATFLSRGTRQRRDAAEWAQTVRLWRLWAALFLNHDRFRCVSADLLN